jgi:hypothetical protein
MKMETLATTSTITSTKSSDVSLTASLDSANELQIIHQNKPVEELEIGFKDPNWPIVTIRTFADWTLSASHMGGSSELVTWEVDAAGNVEHTFSRSDFGQFIAIVTITVVATQSSTSSTKKKEIKISLKPVGSIRGFEVGEGPGHGHGHGHD